MTQTAFRLSDESLAKLDAIAERRAISRAAALRQLIDEADDEVPDLDALRRDLDNASRGLRGVLEELSRPKQRRRRASR